MSPYERTEATNRQVYQGLHAKQKNAEHSFERIYRSFTPLNSQIGSNSTLLPDCGANTSPRCPPTEAARIGLAKTEDPRPSAIRRCYHKMRGKFTRSRRRSIQDRPPTPFHFAETRAFHIPEEPDEEEPVQLGKKWWAVWEDRRAVPGQRLPRGPRLGSEEDLNVSEQGLDLVDDANIPHLRLPSPVRAVVVGSLEDPLRRLEEVTEAYLMK